MNMKVMKNRKYLQQKFSRNVLVPQTTADFTSRVSKSYVPFTCKFPMVIHFMPILNKRCRPKTNFYVFSYDKTSLKFCASFRFFLAVFMEKFQTIRYLNYVRRGIGQIYPAELAIKDMTESNASASYLKSFLSIGRHGQLRTTLYDKRDDFNIINFRFPSSNIPSSPADGVFISQIIRYSNACSFYECLF